VAIQPAVQIIAFVLRWRTINRCWEHVHQQLRGWWPAMRLPIGDVLGFATGATTPESLDSYKVRSNTIRRAQEVGLVRVTRYGKTAGYVASPELIDGLSEQACKLVALVDELHAARPLLDLEPFRQLCSTTLRDGKPNEAVQPGIIRT
jgi:hypothetical protein